MEVTLTQPNLNPNPDLNPKVSCNGMKLHCAWMEKELTHIELNEGYCYRLSLSSRM